MRCWAVLPQGGAPRHPRQSQAEGGRETEGGREPGRGREAGGGSGGQDCGRHHQEGTVCSMK